MNLRRQTSQINPNRMHNLIDIFDGIRIYKENENTNDIDTAQLKAREDNSFHLYKKNNAMANELDEDLQNIKTGKKADDRHQTSSPTSSQHDRRANSEDLSTNSIDTCSNDTIAVLRTRACENGSAISRSVLRSDTRRSIVQKKNEINASTPQKSVKEISKTYDKYIIFMKKHKISVSTITLNCKLHTRVRVKTFAKYIKLKPHEVEKVNCGPADDKTTNRSIIPPHLRISKKKKKAKSKKQTGFYNQVTVLMRPSNTDVYMNIKIFKNGTLQITGCKDVESFMEVGNKLIKILQEGSKNKSFLYTKSDINIMDLSVNMIYSFFSTTLFYCFYI